MQTLSAENLPNIRFAIPERILVATDLLDSEFLIPHVIAQAKATGASIILVHAIQPADSFSIYAGAIPYIDPPHVEAEANSALLAIAAQIECHGIACEAIANHGFAAEVIQEAIHTTGATRLIMATHGRGKWGQLMLGSVASQLLRTVSIPVFAVGPRSRPATAHVTPRKILHPVSMTGDYRTSVKLAMDLAAVYGAELTLLHIPDRDVEQSIHPGCTLSWAENLAAELIPETENSAYPVYIAVAFGNTVEEIRAAATRINADWIVLGVGESFASWPLSESTAYRVLSLGDCPVLTVPHDMSLPQRADTEQARFMTVVQAGNANRLANRSISQAQ
jgi:nucleotide-binding universal stress UspA family protein